MRTSLRPVLPLLVLLLALLTSCAREHPEGAPSTRPSIPSPSASATSAGPLPDPGPGARVGSAVRQRILPGGRTYFVGVPTCTGSTGCEAWLAHPRKLIISLHGALEPEDAAHAAAVINGVSAAAPDAVAVYGVSARGDRVWDADLCCTFRKVDEIGYLRAIIGDVDQVAPVAAGHVGLVGVSNGGMLATKAICERPDLFRAVAVWAASWRGRCDRGPVTIGHWHGSADATIPVRGGTTDVLRHDVDFPPAGWLKGRLAPGSEFKLVVVPGAPHWPAPPWAAQAILAWLDGHL